MIISIVQNLKPEEFHHITERDLGIQESRYIQFQETREEEGTIGDGGQSCPFHKATRRMARAAAQTRHGLSDPLREDSVSDEMNQSE